MAVKAKLDILVSTLCYAGNGGYSAIHPSIKNWWAKTYHVMRADDRIGDIFTEDPCDTPVPMVRNKAVENARTCGADVLVMVDSDMWPDRRLGRDPSAKPFWDSSFDLLYERWCRGDYTVIGAPYCGPPPHESPYVFTYRNFRSAHPNPDLRLEMFSREEVVGRTGFEEVAALPTGLIMYDMRIFQVMDPPYFYYEYKDKFQSEKASTEDVTATRDVSLLTQSRLGYNPCFCNWDAWAGHMKPLCVDKPQAICVEDVALKYHEAMRHGIKARERLTFVGEGKNGRIPENSDVR